MTPLAEALTSHHSRRDPIAGVPLTNVVTGNMYTNTRRALHPSHAVVFDDIYFGYLVFRAFSNRSLTLVNALLSEVDKKKPLEERLIAQLCSRMLGVEDGSEGEGRGAWRGERRARRERAG